LYRQNRVSRKKINKEATAPKRAVAASRFDSEDKLGS
jgi:hypothetical protein